MGFWEFWKFFGGYPLSGSEGSWRKGNFGNLFLGGQAEKIQWGFEEFREFVSGGECGGNPVGFWGIREGLGGYPVVPKAVGGKGI